MPEWPDAARTAPISIARRNDWWKANVIDQGVTLTPLGRALLMRYVGAARGDGSCGIQTASIAEHLGYNCRSVIRDDNRLVSVGLVQIDRRVNDRTVYVLGWAAREVARGVAQLDEARGVAHQEVVEDYYCPEEDLKEEVVVGEDPAQGVARKTPAREVAHAPVDFTGVRRLLAEVDIDEDGQRFVCSAIASGTTTHARVVAVHANLIQRGKAKGNGGLARKLVLDPNAPLARAKGPGGTTYHTPEQKAELIKQAKARVAQIEREGENRRENERAFARSMLESMHWKNRPMQQSLRLVV